MGRGTVRDGGLLLPSRVSAWIVWSGLGLKDMFGFACDLVERATVEGEGR